MSYILEALRKADAQRQRERPSLHAQPAAALDDAGSRTWARSPLLWGGVIAAVVVLAVAFLWSSGEPPAVTAPVADIPSPAPAPAAPVVVAQSPSAPASVVTPAPAPATTIEPPAPPPRPAAPAPAAAATAGPVARPAPARAASAAVPASAPAVAAAAPAASAKPAEGPPPPDAPKLAITGGVYSQDPAQRMLIVGGQVFNEGSQVAPGVVLEQVRPHQAVLSFRGQRYTVGY